MTSNAATLKIFSLVAKISGHNIEDLEPDLFLESDLGLDSIKTVELLNSLIELIPADRQEDFLQTVPMDELMQLQTLAEIIAIAQDWLSSDPPEDHQEEVSSVMEVPDTIPPQNIAPTHPEKTITANSHTVREQIYTLVSQISGHNIEDLEPDLFLESDLGLDSIKTVELLNNLIELIPEERQGDFLQEVPMDQLMQLQTLAEIIDIAQNWLVSSESEPTNISPVIEEKEITEETVELVDSQYIFLATHFANSSCSVCSAVRFKGSFDPQVAEKSWLDLLFRHPMLRAYFSIPADADSFKDYQLRVINYPQPPEISVVDLRQFDAKTQESQIQDAVNQAINETWDLQHWPLHRFFAFRLEDSVYELGLTHHHIIADGLSNQIILREFIEIYAAKLNGTEPTLPPVTSLETYRKQIQKINDWQDSQAEQALQDYLTQQGKAKFIWSPHNQSIPSKTAKVRSLRYRLDSNLTTALMNRTRECRLSLNSILVGAYLQAINTISQQNQPIILNVPTSGRTYSDVDVSNLVGCFAENLALSFSSPQKEQDRLTFLQAVQSQIQTVLASGCDQAQTRQMGSGLRNKIKLKNGQLPNMAVELMRTAIKSNLFFSNIGKTHLKSQYGSLELVDYRSATVTNSGCIDTLAELFSDRLYFNTNYDSNVFCEDLIDRLFEAFFAELKSIVVEIQPNSVRSNSVTLPQNSRLSTVLQDVASQICHLSINEGDFGKDLEADLGVDSLELIRLITAVEKQLAQKLNRQALLGCRTLAEMVQALTPSSSASDNAEIPYLAICEQAKQTPNAVAVLDPNTPLTYQQLHRLSNQVAHYLRSSGVKPGDLIGIMTQRNSFLWVGILGILKAGAAYVPIDPAYPSERICYMLNHAEISILLTESQLTDQLEPCLMSELPLQGLVFLDHGAHLAARKPLKQVNRGVWSQESDADLPLVNTPDDLMVVLYTSGSTGRPKGVMLNHRGYMNRLQWMQKTFTLKSGDRVAQKTSCCFDISIWEIFWPLMVGATVCPVDKQIVKDPWSLATWLNDTQINVMHFVPSLFGEFVNALAEDHYTFPHLRWLIFSGEALPIPFIQAWFDQYGTTTGLANLYGPTEASIDVSCHIIRQRPQEGETSIPIGQAIDHVDLLVLDENRQPVTPGEMGELWIGGVQLAQGYLKDPERTAKAFCANPFSHIVGKSIYRTGDLAKQLPDGSFEYHGRRDHQVKIRGFRVELGEIESVLLSHPAVKEAAVVVMEFGSGQKRLVAGLVGDHVDVREMKEFLKLRLTDYMIPHRLEWFPNLPKNHNGKLDRKALLTVLNGEEISAPVTVSEVSPEPTAEYLPLGPAQRWLLQYFDAPYQWAGYTRCLYHQPLDLEIFNQALNCLVERHWALRTVIVQRQGQWWQQEIRPTEPLQAIFFDASHLSPERRDVKIHQQIEEVGQTFRIDCWPLIQVLVIKVSETCYDINTIGHHIIGDLLSNQLLFQEFWFIYSQLLGGQEDFLKDLPPTASYADYVTYLMTEEQQGNLDSHIDYWKSQFPTPQSAFQIPLDQQLGTNLETSAMSEWFTLPKDETAFLLNRAKKYYGCNVYSLLLAPLYRLMGQWSGDEQVVLSHRSHSRNLGPDNQFFSSVGNFATNFPLGLSVNHQEGWKPFVKRIKDKFNGLPMNGSTFDWIGKHLPSYLYPDNHLTPVRANYFGNRNVRPSEIFEFIKEDWDRRLSPPEQKRTTLLEFFFCITDDCLELQIEYSSNFHFSETIRQLGQDYLRLLRDLLAEVPQEKKTVKSPSVPNTVPVSQLSPQLSGPLTGQVAIVTGAGRGIGRAIALKLASQGAKVAALARNMNQLEETVSQIQQFGGEAIAISVDISELEAVEAAFKQVAEQWGGINILVNNAGITGFATLANSDPAKWRRIVEVNVFGTYYCCRTVIPYLLQQNQGKIINLGSDSSFVGYPLFSAYAASKHGVVGLTKSLAEELKQKNIQVNAVCPAFVDTDLTPKAFRDDSIPTEQIGEVVAFLASPVMSSITGECLKVYGQQDMFFYGSQNMLEPFKNRTVKDKKTSDTKPISPSSNQESSLKK